MTTWQKLTPEITPGLFMTDSGDRLQDGRWLCVVQGPKPTYSPKTMFCNLEDGVWFDDGFGGGDEIPDWLVVTHVCRPPELP